MALPIPFRVQTQGASDESPSGSIPIALYGASGGAGGPVAIGDVTGLTAALGAKVEESVFEAYQSDATNALEGLESAVQTDRQNLSNTTATANTALQPSDYAEAVGEVGIARAVVIDNGDTVPEGTPLLAIVLTRA